jgi:hypothetical protein
MPATKKKSKRREQHERAIAGYEKWLAENPQAKRRKRIQMFDCFVDSSELEEIFA